MKITTKCLSSYNPRHERDQKHKNYLMENINDYIDYWETYTNFWNVVSDKPIEAKIYFDKLIENKNVGIDENNKFNEAVYKKMHRLKKEQENSEFCPLCGLNKTQGEQLDHVFPKDKFIKLYYFNENLIFICATCNRKKSNFSPKSIDETIFNANFSKEKNSIKDIFLKIIVNDDNLNELKINIKNDYLTNRQKNFINRIGLICNYNTYGIW